MLLLIDAYNLLHQSDAMMRGRGERWLERARNRLIQRVSARLDERLRGESCMVFDAAEPPPGSADTFVQEGIQIRFAVSHQEADDLIEELIAKHAAPKRLMVVSSDHRIQRAAQRRGARSMDADLWYARLQERGPVLAIPWPPNSGASAPAKRPSEKPKPPSSNEERDEWLEWFGLDEE